MNTANTSEPTIQSEQSLDDKTAWSIVPTVARLRENLSQLSASYRTAEPYPHIVLDDFLPPEIAAAIAADFPSPSNDKVWNRLSTDDQRGKSSLRHESVLPHAVRRLIHELNSYTLVEFLEELSGIKDLISDPKLVGGGIHQSHVGGKLSVHLDYSHHPNYQLFRRINLIVYLSPDWREEYGGHFELWDSQAKECKKKVLPAFNRCVIFNTNAISYHGVPEPLTCPPDRQRNSVALYYYTNGAEGGLRPEDTHNTIFRSRPGEKVPMATRLVRAASGGLLQDLMPPVVYRAIRRAWNK
jgi:Rps23 Pro-64 3,4-dihydroxylase Tpa1-like proline 4-hydroxylase